MSEPCTNTVPEWAKKVVWYQIFPERFRNGDPRSNPTVNELRGASPHDCDSPWEIHPWTSDWYELQPYEKANGHDIWYNIQRRRYGGDLQGIIDRLDYLQELGIGAIYLNPVFESPSHHKYDGATYHHIDPNFGPDPYGDRKLMATETPHNPNTWVWTAADKLMLALIREIHRRKMRIIFDGVFNHVGTNCWAFQDLAKHQEKSIYKDWFDVKSWHDPSTNSGFKYRCWWAIPDLPEWRQDRQGLVAGPKEYVFAATRRWMDPNTDGDPEDGIDGWRLDVAYEIRHPFWKDWRKLVKSMNPQAYLTAEVIDRISVLQPYLQGDEFDAVMNYNFAFTCVEYFVDNRKAISTTEFDKRLRELRQAFPSDTAYLMQNLLDSHDSNRIGSLIVNRDLLSYRDWLNFHRRSKATNSKYKTTKPTRDELRMQKLLAIFQMTYIGAPMIFYGDEAGMWGANDPDCRKPMIWDDLSYQPEVYLPDGSRRDVPDTVAINTELLDHYRRLIHIRNSNPAFQLGDYRTLLADDSRRVYGFSRRYKDQLAVVILNNSDAPQNVRVDVESGKRFQDGLNNESGLKPIDGGLDLIIEAKWGRILVG